MYLYKQSLQIGTSFLESLHKAFLSKSLLKIRCISSWLILPIFFRLKDVYKEFMETLILYLDTENDNRKRIRTLNITQVEYIMLWLQVGEVITRKDLWTKKKIAEIE